VLCIVAPLSKECIARGAAKAAARFASSVLTLPLTLCSPGGECSPINRSIRHQLVPRLRPFSSSKCRRPQALVRRPVPA